MLHSQNTNNDTGKVTNFQNFNLTTSPNRYKVDSSSTVAKMQLKDIENPQVYNTISKNIIKEQVVVNLQSALKNATGISRLWESTGRGGDGSEYYSMRGFSLQPTLINGMPGISNGGLDPANIESIEVIKGPSGTLFGGNLISYGGLINVITKSPFEKFGGNVSYIGGSFGLNRLSADINTPINDKLFIRVNTAFHSENSFQDAGFSKSFFIAPSLKYVANKRVTFLFNSEYKSSESANAPMIFLSRYSPLSFNSIELFQNNYERSFTGNSLSIKNPTLGMQSQLLIQLNDQWNSQTILSGSNTRTDGYYHYLWDAANGDEFTRFISKRNGETISRGIQQNVNGKFKLFGMQNKLLIGVDYFEKEIRNNSTAWVAHGKVSLKNGTDSGVLSPLAVDNSLQNSSEGNSIARTKIFSAYISDVIYFRKNISAMISVRMDNFTGKPNYYSTDEVKNQTTLSPKLGLVYQPIMDKLSVFANYMNGFRNLDPSLVSDINGNNPTMKIFEPEQANQMEFGVKTNVLRDRLSVTASYYDILVGNKVMPDPNNVNNFIQGGEVKSSGFEVSVISNPIKGFSMVAGYSMNNSKVTKDAENAGYLNLRPEEAGPEQLINLWLSYKVQKGALKNFGLGFGMNNASEYLTLNRANIGTFALPAYTVFNTVLSYQLNDLGLNFKVDNIGNVKYYSGWSTVTPQRPRSVSLALHVKF